MLDKNDDDIIYNIVCQSDDKGNYFHGTVCEGEGFNIILMPEDLKMLMVYISPDRPFIF